MGPGGSWEAPGGLPEGSRDSGRPPERSKGIPEDHFTKLWSNFGVILTSFLDQTLVNFACEFFDFKFYVVFSKQIIDFRPSKPLI